MPDTRQSRDYVQNKLSEEIHEIVRVLQLTTYDEDEWDKDDVTVMKKALNALSGRMKHANDWLSDPNALCGTAGWIWAIAGGVVVATRYGDSNWIATDRVVLQLFSYMVD